MNLDSILLRALVAALLVLFGLAFYWSWNRYQLRRLGAARAGRLHGLEDLKSGVPGILYFTTPDCAVCLTTQKPALRRLQAELGESGVQVIEVDATVRPDLADYWGVLSVPTTFVIDTQGQPQHFNPGLASTEKLRSQLDAARQPGRQAPAESQAHTRQPDQNQV
jgi:thioredoxin 1